MYRTIISPSIIWLLMLCASFSINPAAATEPEPDAATWSLPELMRSLAQIKSSKATFVERKHLSMLKTPLSFSGTLEYQAPDQLVKHTLLPKPEKMTLNHDKLVVQSGDASASRTLSLQEYPSIWAFVESIRSTLAGDIETLNRFYDVSLKGQEKQWQLILRPADSKIKSLVNEILIKGSFDQINTIEIREAGGDYSVMSITRDDS
jgi:hypothetical protein